MFGKFLCAAALVSTALAQQIDIAAPAAGTTVTAGSAITVQLERPTPSTDTQEVAVAIGGSPCPAGCINPGLGTVLFTGLFDPKSTNSAGNEFQNVTVTIPNWFNGPMELNVAHFYILGVTTHTAELEFTNTTLNVVGGSG